MLLLSICSSDILWSLNDVFAQNFTGNLGVNTIEHVSEMKLDNILSTLEKFERWNRTVLITKYQWMNSI